MQVDVGAAHLGVERAEQRGAGLEDGRLELDQFQRGIGAGMITASNT